MKQFRLWMLGGVALAGLGGATILGQPGGPVPEKRLPSGAPAPDVSRLPGFPKGEPPVPASAPTTSKLPLPLPPPTPVNSARQTSAPAVPQPVPLPLPPVTTASPVIPVAAPTTSTTSNKPAIPAPAAQDLVPAPLPSSLSEKPPAMTPVPRNAAATPPAPTGTTPPAPAITSTFPGAAAGFPAATQTAEPTPAAPTEKQPDPILSLDSRPGRQEPSVSIEWSGPPTARLNHAVPFQLLVRNTCAFPVHDVVVRHRLPKGILHKGSEPAATAQGEDLVWNLGTLPAGQVRRIDLNLQAQVRGALNCQATVTFTGSSYHQVVVREPQLLVKMRAPETVIAGETVTLLFALSNPGDGATEAVKIKVALPEGLEHQRGRSVEVDIGALAPKEIRTMQMVCIAKAPGQHKCAVVATAEGNLTTTDAAQVNVLLPKLDLVMNGPKLRYIDRRASYSLKVLNPGSAPAHNVALQEVVPAGFKYHASTGGGVFDEATRTISWTLGDLMPGQHREVTVDLVPTAQGAHRLAAQVTTSRGLRTEAEVHTQVEGLPALAIELADTDDPVEVGGATTYEIRVMNTGTKTETNVEVVCTLPEHVEFRGAKAGANLRHRVEGREVIFEPLPRLSPRADVIYRLEVRGKLAGDARFRTRVRADGLNEPVLREESTRIYNDNPPLRQ